MHNLRTFASGIVFLLFAVTSIAQINFFVFPQSASPDSMILMLNGGVGAQNGSMIDWGYDWDDGTYSTGFFPKFHHYQLPGTYTVIGTAYNDLGDDTTSQFTYSFGSIPASDVDSVTLSQTFTGLLVDSSIVVDINVFDELGYPLSMAGREIEYFMVSYDALISVTIQDSSIEIAAGDPGLNDASYASMFVYVDKVRSAEPINIIINSNLNCNWSAAGNNIGIFLPDTFYTGVNIEPEEIIEILDLAFHHQNRAVDELMFHVYPVLFQCVSYSPPVYGASGNPLRLGDAAVSFWNGTPHFDVMFHEMGHNFSTARHMFWGIAYTGPFFHETIAEWFVQYTIDSIVDSNSTSLSTQAIDDLMWISNEGFSYHEWEYNNYVSGGCQFDYNNISSSHALVHMIYTYCDSVGWEPTLNHFFDCFDHTYDPYCSQVFGRYGGLDATDRTTVFLAALSHAVGVDVRPDFVPLNFPINDSLFTDLTYLYLGGPAIIASHDTINFGCMEVGTSEEIELTLISAGMVPLELFNVELDPVNEFGYWVNSAYADFGDTIIIDITFSPTYAGPQTSTLTIQSNAVNQSMLEIPVFGEGGGQPAPVEDLTITVDGSDAILNWSPVTHTVGGTPITPDAYLIFYTDTSVFNYAHYQYLWRTLGDTTFTHPGVAFHANSMFYYVIAYLGDLRFLNQIIETPARSWTFEDLCR